MTLTSTHEPQGRAFGPGLAAVRHSKWTPYALIGLGVVVAAGVVIGTQVHTGSTATKFGGFASYLPKNTVDGSALHKTVDASVASPALASQGDTVRVHVGSASVMATVVGPEVPNEGLPYQADTSPAQWTVTLAGATGSIPLNVAQFTSSDDQGTIYHPTLTSGQAALPATIPDGKTLTFTINTVMRTGEGLLRWAPDTGSKFPVAWDFTVEDD